MKTTPKQALYLADISRRFKQDYAWPQVLADEVRRLTAALEEIKAGMADDVAYREAARKALENHQ